jgi:hypothetical protein
VFKNEDKPGFEKDQGKNEQVQVLGKSPRADPVLPGMHWQNRL